MHCWLVRRLKGRIGLPAGIVALLVPVPPDGPLFWPRFWRYCQCRRRRRRLGVGYRRLHLHFSVRLSDLPVAPGRGRVGPGNLIRPLLICRQAPVSTLALFVGVIGGVSAFGIIGC